MFDVQFRTILRDLRHALGSDLEDDQIVLDLGCGEGPYRSLFSCYGARSVGIDVPSGFGMDFRPGTVLFDGYQMPLRNQSFDWVVATEVLEHVACVERLLDEVALILKEGGYLFLTTPWSARIHHEPNDYRRPTPYLMRMMMHERGFVPVWENSRGSLVSVLYNKVLISTIDSVVTGSWRMAIIPFAIPLIASLWVSSFVFECMRISSPNDPLGFSFLYRKVTQVGS